MAEVVKFRLGKLNYQMHVEQRGNRFFLSYGFNKALTEELKASFEGMKWHGYDDVRPEKKWSFPLTQHNAWRFNFYTGKDPYLTYDVPPVKITDHRGKLKPYQLDMAEFLATYRRCILGAGMGTGKTLATITALEHLGVSNVLWVAPRSALYSVEVEFEKWKCELPVTFLTYQGAVKLVKEWKEGAPVPQALVVDESQRIKNASAQQTQACTHIADAIRVEHGPDGVVILLSGTPSPKSPVDWWSQSRAACPGFLREGHYKSFQARMAFVKQEMNEVTNTPYPKLVTWWDDENKCKHCGQFEKDAYHNLDFQFPGGPYHKFEKSINEVAALYRRLKGLVKIVLKSEVLSELPEKIYRTIRVAPLPSTIRAARLIMAGTDRGATCLTRLRELSDGFQYDSVPTGTRPCSACDATGIIKDSIYTGPQVDEFDYPSFEMSPDDYTVVDKVCPRCHGTLVEDIIVKEARQVPTPKEKVLTDLLRDEFADDGRVVIWAGFHGSLDRCLEIVQKCGWNYICVDGRGWRSDVADKPKDMLRIFQDKSKDYKIAFIAHPGSGGTGLTLTAASAAIYFSNDFSYEARAQSEDRIHRLGMDMNRGCSIIDIIHLPSDQYVLDNLLAKKKLMAVSMGDIQTALDTQVSGSSGYGVRG